MSDFVERMIVIAIGGAVVAVFVARTIVGTYRYRRDVRLPRADLTIDVFAQSLAGRGYSDRAIRDTYKDLLDWCGHPASASDSFQHSLWIDPDDVDCLLRSRLEKLGMQLSDLQSAEYRRFVPLRTVEDYVALLSRIYETVAAKG